MYKGTIVYEYISFAGFYVSGDAEGDWDYEAIAAVLEDSIFKEFKNTETKYKNKVRSRVSNLKVCLQSISLRCC